MNEFVPEGWAEYIQGDVADFSNGKAYKLTEWEKVGTPVIRLQNLTGSGKNFYYSNLQLPKRQYCKRGDLLYMWSATFGPHIWKGPKAIYHYHIWKITCNEKDLTKPYLYHLLGYKTAEWLNKSNGMGILHITKGGMEELKLLLPPLPEQQKIAAILTSVDEVIENTQAQINKLKDLKTGMMQELLTRGVGVDGKPHTEFKDSPVGRIPKAWEVLPLSSLAITKGLQTGPFGGQLHADEYTEKGIPVIMPKNMKSNNVCIQNIARISEDKAIELSKHRVMEGDIVFSRRGDIGRFVLINKKNEGWLCGTGSLRARLDRTTILPLYLSSYLTLDLVIEWLNNNAVGQTMLNLNTSILGELPVVLPPIYEQELIANSIESIDKRLGILGRKLSQIQKSKKALMQDLLTGKVRVKVDTE